MELPFYLPTGFEVSFPLCFFCWLIGFAFGATPSDAQDYSSLCTLILIITVFGGPNGMPGNQTQVDMCKASALTSMLAISLVPSLVL